MTSVNWNKMRVGFLKRVKEAGYTIKGEDVVITNEMVVWLESRIKQLEDDASIKIP